MKQNIFAVLFLFLCVLILTNPAFSQNSAATLAEYNEPPSRMRGMIEKFNEDYGSLDRFYTARTSPNRAARMRQLYSDELAALNGIDFEKLNHDEQVDYILFKNYLEHEQKELDRNDKQLAEMADLIPFARTISDLEDSRRKLETIDPAKIAAILNDLNKQIAATQKHFEDASTTKPKRTVANRAARTVASLRNTLKNWFTFYNAYDPNFTWWNVDPYKTADDALAKYQTFITEKLVGIKPDDKTTIIGDPIGREALIDELRYEMIPYTPEELVEIANKEFAWCEAEMKKASREMGYVTTGKRHLRLSNKNMLSRENSRS